MSLDSVIKAGDVSIAVRDFGGTGSAVLLIPGAGRTLVDLTPLAAHLPDRRVVAMDLRNHGKSGDGEWKWESVIADVCAVVEHFELIEPVIAGHSLGGMIAAMYAGHHEDIRAAINLDGHVETPLEYYDMDPDEVLRLRAELRGPESGENEADEGADTILTADEIEQLKPLVASQATAFNVTEELMVEAFERGLEPYGENAFRVRPRTSPGMQMMAAVEELDLIDIYRRATRPVIVYNATKIDAAEMRPQEAELVAAFRRGISRVIRQLAEEQPNVKLVEIDATHALITEQAERLAQDIRELTS